MAPEQLEGKPVDARTDIFALGTVLYEMAAGRKAFQGDSTASLIAAILTTEPERVSAARAAAASRAVAGRPGSRRRPVPRQAPGRSVADGPRRRRRTAVGRPARRRPAVTGGSPGEPRPLVACRGDRAGRGHARSAARARPSRRPFDCAASRRASPSLRHRGPPSGSRRTAPASRCHPTAGMWCSSAGRMGGRTCGSDRCRRSSRSVSTAPRAHSRRSGRPTAGSSATSPTPPASCGRSWRRGGRRRPSAPRRATAARRGGATAPFSSRSFAMDSTACRRPGAARCA